MRAWGFDSLRLPISWSAVAPTQDGFDETYLDRVEQAVTTAAGAGLLVLIDVHQDAYSKEIGEDGAPLWAIFPPPSSSQLLGGPLDDLDARRQSDIVQQATGAFFDVGGLGGAIRPSYYAMLAHVIARFESNPMVLGFELFNEPHTSPPALAKFDAEVFAAARAATPDKLLVLQPDASRDDADMGAMPTAPFGAGAAYAPHFYRLALSYTGDTDAERTAMTKATLTPQVASAQTEAKAANAPLLATEWGYDPRGIQASSWITWESEQYQASSFFWLWKEESLDLWGCFDHDATSDAWTERADVKKSLARVRPSAIAGWPTSFSFDRATGHFELDFTSDPAIAGPSVIAIAKLLGAPTSATCDGAMIATTTPDANGMLDVPCGEGDARAHVITVDVAAMP
jgi:endoglycosylceramidase